jgi:hypothetical protein
LTNRIHHLLGVSDEHPDAFEEITNGTDEASGCGAYWRYATRHGTFSNPLKYREFFRGEA